MLSSTHNYILVKNFMPKKTLFLIVKSIIIIKVIPN